MAAVVVLASAAPSATAQQGDPSVARMRHDVEAFVAGGPREAGTAGEQAGIDHVVGALRGLGLSPSVTDVPLVNGRTSHNVSVSFGTGLVEILLGAHIDTVRGSPGADDNASGVAVLLEYARLLDSGAAPVWPDTTITLVWFGAEERLVGYDANTHHAGSRQLAAARAATATLPHWMLSVDMVGYGPRPLAVYFGGTTADAAVILDACGGDDASGGPAELIARGDISDHEAFGRRGTAAALLWRPDNPDYHGPGDTEVVDENLLASLRTAQGFVACGAVPWAHGRTMAHELLVALLARRPDLGGAGFWATRLAPGADGPGRVGSALVGSPEWASTVAPVARVYLAAFGRDADHGGLVHWTGLRRAGAPLDAVAAAVVASPEFAARNGAPDTRGFVRLLYRNVLGRDADAAGEAHWVGELDSGRLSRAQVVVAFAESAEHRSRTARTLPVALAYEGLLRRPVDADGLAYWSARPVAELIGGLVGSAEFAGRYGG